MLKRISIEELELGMFVRELCDDLFETHPKTNFILDDKEELIALKRSKLTEAWIDLDKGLNVGSANPAKTSAHSSGRRRGAPTSLEHELQTAQRLCEEAKSAVIDMFHNARLGEAVNVQEAQQLIQEIGDSVQRQPHALLSLARLKDADDYTYMHSVAVCVLMIALARKLGLPEDQVRECGLGGLLHDVGKVGIANTILNKPGRLTDEEFALIKGHPEIGIKVLASNTNISPAVFDIILHHHEKVDGTGYPHRLAGPDISLVAKMGAVCDVYDAITSDRPYKAGWPPAESIRRMAEWSKNHLDEAVFKAFVKTVGIYPVGSLVRLESGKLGVVVDQHETSLLMPKVTVFFSAKLRSPIVKETIDLSQLQGREKIIGIEPVEKWGFKDLDSFWRD